MLSFSEQSERESRDCSSSFEREKKVMIQQQQSSFQWLESLNNLVSTYQSQNQDRNQSFAGLKTSNSYSGFPKSFFSSLYMPPNSEQSVENTLARFINLNSLYMSMQAPVSEVTSSISSNKLDIPTTNILNSTSSEISNLEELLADTSLPESNLNSPARTQASSNDKVNKESYMFAQAAELSAEASQKTKKRKHQTSPAEFGSSDLKKCKVVLMTGQWTAKEEGILLHLTVKLVDLELKMIAAACQQVGVLRGQRAIDKKLKRLVGFSEWKVRDRNEILEKVRILLGSKLGYNLDQETTDKVNTVVVEYAGSGRPEL